MLFKCDHYLRLLIGDSLILAKEGQDFLGLYQVSWDRVSFLADFSLPVRVYPHQTHDGVF